jgi:hypothetical protein
MTTNTTVTHENLVRDDVRGERVVTRRAPVSRAWALTGLGAGIAGFASMMVSGSMSVIYPEGGLNAEDVQEKVSSQDTQIIVFHLVTTLAAVLVLPFAAGLYRRVRAAVSADSLTPGVAAAGLLALSSVLILGAGLDTEFLFGGEMVVAENAAMYSHWVATISWLWTTAGITGLALFVAGRQGGVPRWIGIVGLVLGGLTVALGLSPYEYMAGMTGPVWLIVTALGFIIGDRRHRG